MRVRTLDSRQPTFDAQFAELVAVDTAIDREIDRVATAIVDDVRTRGDAALLEYTNRFDRMRAAAVAELEIPAAEMQAALDALPNDQRVALETAARRIRAYHERQVATTWTYTEDDGTELGQRVNALDSVGLYVPGGLAAYPSSLLMNALPAHVAGVANIVMVVPTPDGKRNPLVLAAAALAGVSRAFAIGGAQAVAALAYGTATVPRVDKITGPGNAYVASAKKRVFGSVGIDMIAGPSEILVLADGSTPADWVAMDLFSQAEHDELAQSILLCPDAAYVDAVQEAIERLLPAMPRRDVIRASLEGRGALIHTRSMEEACEISNRIAPEHLEVSALEPQRWEPLLRHAGAIFLGAHTSESLGDYCAGPNHVLPTSGTARFSSPLGVYDFVKRSSLIEVSAFGAQVLGPVASVLAHGEGLQAHARAAEMRLEGPVAGPVVVDDIEVRPVTRDNLAELMRLDVAPGQSGFVAPVARSVAQASFETNARSLGLYAGGVAVGYLLLWDTRFDPDEPADELYVWRLLIDARFQRRGLGAAAMRWVIAEARRLGVAQVGLSHVIGNDGAASFYARQGFAYTGRVEDGEREMALRLKA